MLVSDSNKRHILVLGERSNVRIIARFVLEDNHYQVGEAESPNTSRDLFIGD
jgi:hypothetical protein